MARTFPGRRVALFTALVPALIIGSMNHVSASEENSGRFGASFLRVPVGARVMAVPDIVAAMQPDASLTFSNPAALAQLSQGQLFLSSANWLDDMSLSAASYATPLASTGLTWTAGARLLYSGNLQGFDASNQVIEEDNYYDVAATTGLSKHFEDLGLALGADVTYLREHMPDQDGDGVSLSLGGSYEFKAHRVDVWARDIGGKIAYQDRDYKVDSRAVVGYGYRLNRGWGRLDMGGQVTVARSRYQHLRIGANFAVNNHLSLRSGYNHAFEAETSTGVPISAGFGFHYRTLNLDYAFTEHEFFSNTHTFSLTFGFGRGGQATSLSATDPTVNATPAQPAVAPAPLVETPAANATHYVVIAGIHGRMESARAEVRALRLLKVPAVVEQTDGKYRVVIGQYDSRKSAEGAVKKYEQQGHRFSIVEGSS